MGGLTTGSIVPTADVELWVRQSHPFPHYVALVTELPQPEKKRVHVTTEITGPNGQRIEHNGRRAVYYSFRAFEGMDQVESEWVL
jgi:hypothetical protein